MGFSIGGSVVLVVSMFECEKSKGQWLYKLKVKEWSHEYMCSNVRQTIHRPVERSTPVYLTMQTLRTDSR